MSNFKISFSQKLKLCVFGKKYYQSVGFAPLLIKSLVCLLIPNSAFLLLGNT